jgi:hypothetical protein
MWEVKISLKKISMGASSPLVGAGEPLKLWRH